MCIVTARPIGVITMNDEKGEDDKIIAVCADDLRPCADAKRVIRSAIELYEQRF